MQIQIPPEEISPLDWLKQVRREGEPSITTLRQGLILRFIWFEPFRTVQGLIHRLGFALGYGYLRPSAEELVEQDLQDVSELLTAAGFELCHRDTSSGRAYFVKGYEQMGRRMRQGIIEGVASVNREEIAMLRKLTPSQHMELGFARVREQERAARHRVQEDDS